MVPSSPLGYGAALGQAVASVYGPLRFTIYPGAASGAGEAYEDDGLTDAYLLGHGATTTCSYTRTQYAQRAPPGPSCARSCSMQRCSRG